MDGPNTLFFSSGETYLQVLWTQPAGNAYYILAHAYIAAELNNLNGASTTPEVDAAMLWASNFFTGRDPDTKITKAEKSALALNAMILDYYNNGYIGPGHCDE